MLVEIVVFPVSSGFVGRGAEALSYSVVGAIAPVLRSRFWSLCVDLVPVAAVAALPWSTSAVAILMAAWVLILVPTICARDFWSSLQAPASYVPAMLLALAIVGLSWAQADWAARLHGISPVIKFGFLPLLFYHFGRSSRTEWVFIAFIASCSVLMVVSWIVYFVPVLQIGHARTAGVPVRNYIDQSQEFALCIFGLAPVTLALFKTGKIKPALACLALLLGFVGNMTLVVIARTAFLYMPIMTVAFALRYLKKTTAALFLVGVAALATLTFLSSPYLRHRIERTIYDYKLDHTTDIATSNGERLFYWRTAIKAIEEAPILGHGTGSIARIFAEAAQGKSGEWANIVSNPHNQMLYVAVEWGLAGALVLLAMWFFHLRLFAGHSSTMAWFGLIVVSQNIVSSLLNSHLFDFHEGWLYVFGVSAAGAAVWKAHKSVTIPEGLGLDAKSA